MILSSTLAPVLASLSARKVVTVELDWRDRSGPLFPELKKPFVLRKSGSSRFEQFKIRTLCQALFLYFLVSKTRPISPPAKTVFLRSWPLTPATISLFSFVSGDTGIPLRLYCFVHRQVWAYFLWAREQYYRGEWYHFFEPFHWHREFPRTKIWTPAEIPKGANSKEEASEEEV